MYNIKELLNHEPITPLSEVLLLSVSLEAAIKAFQGDLQDIYSTAGIDGKGEFLRKVSFDYDLFSKELIKAISCLPEKEALRLFQWSNKLKKPK